MPGGQVTALILFLCAFVPKAHGQIGAFEIEARRAAAQQPVVVLIPGFFNSSIAGDWKPGDGYAPYFSRQVLETIRARATVVVADSLLPVGTVEVNGELLERFLAATIDRFPGRPLIVIAHSAGGLYLMRALTNRPNLPIKTVITLATPYGGIEFVDRLAADVPGLEQLAHFLDLDSLREFRSSRMAEVLGRFSVPDHIRWIAVAGHQPACFLLTCGESRYLSWLLTITQNLMSQASDGIVTVDSALGIGTSIRTQGGADFQMERWADFNFALEHWEMVEDYRYFRTLGVLDVERVRELQAKYFDAILDRLGPVEIQATR